MPTDKIHPKQLQKDKYADIVRVKPSLFRNALMSGDRYNDLPYYPHFLQCKLLLPISHINSKVYFRLLTMYSQHSFGSDGGGCFAVTTLPSP